MDGLEVVEVELARDRRGLHRGPLADARLQVPEARSSVEEVAPAQLTRSLARLAAGRHELVDTGAAEHLDVMQGGQGVDAVVGREGEEAADAEDAAVDHDDSDGGDA